MKYELFSEVVISKDFPEKKLKRGDVATIVEYHPQIDGIAGYSLEVFNVLGDTIALITVSEKDIELLRPDEIFTAHRFESLQA